MMSERFTIAAGRSGAVFTETPDDTGHGAAGQVRKSTFFGRSVTVQGQKLNAGSLIDFLNAGIQDETKKLKKGWFFGSSRKEIQDLFDERFPNQVKTDFVNMKHSPDGPKYDWDFSGNRFITILFGCDMDLQDGMFVEHHVGILHIRIPPEKYSKDILYRDLNAGMQEIANRDLRISHYTFDRDDDAMLADLKEWQKQNGKVEVTDV